MGVAVVTGGNRGIGREVCRQLAARGLSVVLTARVLRDAEVAAKELRVSPAELDVTKPASIAAFAAQQKARGPIDVLVNNAGATFDGFDAEVVRKTLAVNFHGVIAVSDALAPLVRDGGRIVNVSSGMGSLSSYPSALRARFAAEALTRAELLALTSEFASAVAAGDHGARGWPSSAYRVSKAALNAWTRIHARELGPRNVRVNAVDPGWVRTRMGGDGAPRSVEKGAETIVWAAVDPSAPSGKFLRDSAVIEL